MQKGKLILGFAVIVLALAMSTTAFAQATLSISSNPTTLGCSTEHTVLTGSITVSVPSGQGAANASTLTINYGSRPITNVTTTAGGIGSTISLTTSGLTWAAATITVNNATGTIDISLPASANPSGSSLTLSGVRVSLAGSGLTTLNAALSLSAGSTYQITAGQNNTNIVSVVAACMTDPVTTSGLIGAGNQGLGGATVLNSGIASDADWTVDVCEAHPAAFQTTNSQPAGMQAQNGTQIRLEFTGIPAGVTLSLVTSSGALRAPTVVYSGTTAFGTALAAANFSNTAITSSAPTTTFDPPAALGYLNTQTECLRMTGNVSVGSSATIPLALTNITMQATLAPTGTALSSTNTPITAAGTSIPRFQATLQPSTGITIVTVSAANTILLVPSAYSNSAVGDDMAIHVTNTTTDPLSSSLTAKPQTGTLKFTFYPQTGSSQTYTTAAGSPGAGLDASGNLATGRIYTVLLSQLLGVLPTPLTSFTGYVVVEAGFTHAHGNGFFALQNFSNIFAAPFLVVGAHNGSGSRNIGIESLGQ
jgi:hypothetical protein